MNQRWRELLGVSLLALAVAGVPACSGSKGDKGDRGDRGDTGDTGADGADGDTGPEGPTGTAGPTGPDGLDSSIPVAPWDDPVNISRQVDDFDEDAFGPQTVFTPDGRIHVVYFAHDNDTGREQLFYTSAEPPAYSFPDDPVRITDDDEDSPLDFDLTAAADDSVHIAFSRNDSNNGTTTLSYTRNTEAALGTFTETEIFEEFNGTNQISGSRILMSGTTAHVVWTGSDGSNYYQYITCTAATVGTSTVLERPDRFVDLDHFTFKSDGAGSLHLVYYVDNNGRRVLYQPIPTTSANLPSFQTAYDDSDEDESLTFNQGAPIVQFDASNNVYVFWKTTDGSQPTRAIRCNIKAATGQNSSFSTGRDAVVTEFDNDGTIEGLSGDFRNGNSFAHYFDVQVAADGRIHAVWKQGAQEELNPELTAGTNDNFPLFYRTKDPGTDASDEEAWHTAEVVAWLKEPLNSKNFQGGIHRGALVRAAPEGDGAAEDGTIHVFYADARTLFFGDSSSDVDDFRFTNIFHAYRSATGSTWHQAGSVSDPTTSVVYPHGWIDGTSSYLLAAGVEEDGFPYAMFVTEARFFGFFDPFDEGFGADDTTFNSDIFYTHRATGEWMQGTNVDGADHVDPFGDFALGLDPDGHLHAIWQQEVLPFQDRDEYDLMHATTPTESFPSSPIDEASSNNNP